MRTIRRDVGERVDPDELLEAQRYSFPRQSPVARRTGRSCCDGRCTDATVLGKDWKRLRPSSTISSTRSPSRMAIRCRADALSERVPSEILLVRRTGAGPWPRSTGRAAFLRWRRLAAADDGDVRPLHARFGTGPTVHCPDSCRRSRFDLSAISRARTAPKLETRSPTTYPVRRRRRRSRP